MEFDNFGEKFVSWIVGSSVVEMRVAGRCAGDKSESSHFTPAAPFWKRERT